MNKCLNCGKDTTNTKFCSLSCSAKKQNELVRLNAVAPTKQCLNCGESFSYGAFSGTSRTAANKFCTKRCAALHRNRAKSASASTSAHNPKRLCQLCGKETNRWANKYCSLSCANNYKWTEQRRLFLEGHGSVASNAMGLKKWARTMLLEQANYACQQCGWDKRHPVDGLPLVEVDHIDGNHQNNSINNLKVLCPNCHSMTPSYRARNKGNGRKSRSK